MEGLKTPPRGFWAALAVAFGLRLLALIVVVVGDVPLVFDEVGYFERAVAIHGILTAWAGFEVPAADLWDRAYGEGHWPPMHPLVLALGMLIAGPTITVARSVTVVISVATTVLVYFLGCRTVGHRAAVVAAWLYALYPTFVAYSHYLWSETTTVFLLLASLWSASRLSEAVSDRRRAALAAGAGCLLGLAILSRPAISPLLVAVAIWAAWPRDSERWRPAVGAAMLAAGVLVLLPWQAVLWHQEDRWVTLSTLGGFNLALGNHPDVPPALGSSWGHEASKSALRARLDDMARERSTTWEAVARSVALEEIRRDPGAAIVRVGQRLRMLWTPDYFPLRHLFAAVYPPLPPVLALLAAVLAGLAFFALTAFACWGLPADRLALICVMAGMVLPALTIANSRLHLPLLALMLPAAGRTVTDVMARRWRPSVPAVATWLVLAAVALSSVPLVVEHYLAPSGHYAVLGRVGAALGADPVFVDPVFVDPVFVDRLVLRRHMDGLRFDVEVVTPGAHFADGSRRVRWFGRRRELAVDLVSSVGGGDLELVIRSPKTGDEQSLRPLARESWRTWRATGFEGVELRWTGASLKNRRAVQEPPDHAERSPLSKSSLKMSSEGGGGGGAV